MKSLLIIPIVLVVWSESVGQTIKELNKNSKKKSEQTKTQYKASPTSSPENGTSQSDGDNESFCTGAIAAASFCGNFFMLFGKEESRLYERNETENRLYALEVSGTAGIGTKAFWRIQPQARLHLGCLSIEYRHNQLFDVTGNFKTQEFNFWLNFLNRRKIKIRGILGSLYMNSNETSYFNYGASAEYLFEIPLRLEGWVMSTNSGENKTNRARLEYVGRIHYDFWEKGHLKSSIFTGYSSQNYFNEFTFNTIDFGLNYFLSFHSFTNKD